MFSSVCAVNTVSLGSDAKNLSTAHLPCTRHPWVAVAYTLLSTVSC